MSQKQVYDRVETKAVHAGRYSDLATGAVVPSISLSTTFKQLEPAVPFAKFEYSRAGNPNREIFESAVSALENAKYGISFASGLAANTTILHLLPVNSRIIMINDVYGGTYRFFKTVAQPLGYDIQSAELANECMSKVFGMLDGLVTSNTSLLWIESPTNPTLTLCQIQPILEHVKRLNPKIICVVDNTFMTPYYQRPLELGADLVVHSVSKYLNGHSDVIMGIACTNQEALARRLYTLQNSLGTVPGPFNCWLASRGLQTFAIRMSRISQNANTIAHYLASPECASYVSAVFYPGLASHPGHSYLKDQQISQGISDVGYSGMISVDLKTSDPECIKRFTTATQLFCLAESLGGVESLLEVPALMTHAAIPRADRLAVGITDSLVRLSVGIEAVEDLLADLQQAFKAAFHQP